MGRDTAWLSTALASAGPGWRHRSSFPTSTVVNPRPYGPSTSMIRRPDKISRAAETAASSIWLIISGEKVCDGLKFSVMAASFHVANCSSRARPAAFSVAFFSTSGRFLELRDLAARKKIGSQRFIEFRSVTANPFEGHGSVFDFFIHVVLQNRA